MNPVHSWKGVIYISGSGEIRDFSLMISPFCLSVPPDILRLEVQYCGSKKIIYSRVTVKCILPTSGLTEYLAATWLALQTQIVKSLNCLQ